MAESAEIGEGFASERFRVETRRPKFELSRFVKRALIELTPIAGGTGWEEVDIVLVDVSTGADVKTWRESGGAAAAQIEIQQHDLETMTADEFTEKWL